MQPRDERVESLTRRYTEEAGVYQELWAPVLHDVGLGLLRELRGTGPDIVLDVGSGAGTLLPDLQAAFPGARVIGVDRAFGMLQLAPRGPARAVMDAAQLAIAARSVDIALLAFVLFHLPEPRAGLVEARRVLRPGGRVATVTWASDVESPATRIWEAQLAAHGAPPLDAETDFAQHELVDTPEKMTALLESAGFVSIRTWAAPLERHIGLEHLVALRTRLGRHKRRFDSLAARARAVCLERARHQLAALRTEDFIVRGEVVHAIAVG
jgi:SAM-dependent methyltransferase